MPPRPAGDPSGGLCGYYQGLSPVPESTAATHERYLPRHYRLDQSGKTLIIPRMAPHADVIAAAMQAYGVKAVSLPEPDERNILYSNQVTSGTECLPYRVTLGDFLRFYNEDGQTSKDVEGFMSGSFGPCRLGKYAIEQIRILKDMGYDLPIRTTVSNNAYRDIGLGRDLNGWPGKELWQ